MQYGMGNSGNLWGLQWVKKLFQFLAVLQRLTWNKFKKLGNNLKIIYVIV